MDDLKLKELLKKTQLIKFCWESSKNSSEPLWNATYLLDDVDRDMAADSINQDALYNYDLNRGVYLYHAIRNQFKLIAVIKGGKIKVC